MQCQTHILPGDTPGCECHLLSYHFGQRGALPKIYLQAGLHADELPGQLVLCHLRELLQQAEAAGKIVGEMVLVPCANPIGLSQGSLWSYPGRHEQYSGENFNRHYPEFKEQIAAQVASKLGQDRQANTHIIRQALRQQLEALSTPTQLDCLRKTLLSLAHDADVVLDLHCDLEAIMHIYTTPQGEAQAVALARHIGAEVLLLAEDSGISCFDEANSTLWYDLQHRFAGQFPIEAACFAATLELRGLADVSDSLAATDAAGLSAWLIEVGALAGEANCGVFVAPLSTPLAGAEYVMSPCGGLISYHAEVGAQLHAGSPVADIINPLTGERVTVCTRNEGVMFARDHRRFVRKGTEIASVTGMVAYRTGNLLST